MVIYHTSEFVNIPGTYASPFLLWRGFYFGGCMPLRQNPPMDNVRNARVLGSNQRGTITNKKMRTVLTETQAGEILALCLERRQDVIDFISFPIRLKYRANDGSWTEHTPLFKAFLNNNTVEFHDIYSDATRYSLGSINKITSISSQLHALNAHYMVHTENTLPHGTSATNLIFLSGYRAKAFHNLVVREYLLSSLEAPGARLNLAKYLELASRELSISISTVAGCVFHLIWNGDLEIEMENLLCGDGNILPGNYVWVPLENRGQQ